MECDGGISLRSQQLLQEHSHFTDLQVLVLAPLAVLHDILFRCYLNPKYRPVDKANARLAEIATQVTVGGFVATGYGISRHNSKRLALITILNEIVINGKLSVLKDDSKFVFVHDALETFCESHQLPKPSFRPASEYYPEFYQGCRYQENMFLETCSISSLIETTGFGLSDTLAIKHATVKMLFRLAIITSQDFNMNHLSSDALQLLINDLTVNADIESKTENDEFVFARQETIFYTSVSFEDAMQNHTLESSEGPNEEGNIFEQTCVEKQSKVCWGEEVEMHEYMNENSMESMVGLAQMFIPEPSDYDRLECPIPSNSMESTSPDNGVIDSTLSECGFFIGYLVAENFVEKSCEQNLDIQEKPEMTQIIHPTSSQASLAETEDSIQVIPVELSSDDRMGIQMFDANAKDVNGSGGDSKISDSEDISHIRYEPVDWDGRGDGDLESTDWQPSMEIFFILVFLIIVVIELGIGYLYVFTSSVSTSDFLLSIVESVMVMCAVKIM